MRTTMRTVAVGATILLVLALSGCWSTKKFKVVSPTSTPIVYKNLMLVLSNKDGVAAIVFTDEIEYGVKYRYRYLPKHGKEESGEGEVFEKYKRFPGNKPGEYRVVNDGGKLSLKAGPLHVMWSFAAAGKGYIYHYHPQFVRVQTANARDFEKIDLSRFMHSRDGSDDVGVQRGPKTGSP